MNALFDCQVVMEVMILAIQDKAEKKAITQWRDAFSSSTEIRAKRDRPAPTDSTVERNFFIYTGRKRRSALSPSGERAGCFSFRSERYDCRLNSFSIVWLRSLAFTLFRLT